ncbi:MAG TPA: ATP-binding cassette domain-containing protein [Propylenella sp.]|nr:ATP-binding cassette domain-containing protein [Propylenella sp.]
MSKDAARGLELRDIAIRLEGELLVALDAKIAPGDALTVMGPSGVGKSTLLAFVAGFLGRDFSAEGRIVLNGRDVTELPPERRGIGLLFQDALLLPHLSVAGNLLLGLRPDVKGRSARRRAAEAALAEVGLETFADRDPATLSGGQAARVALMRTLLARPEALVLDEPFSRLDAALRTQIRELVFAESRRRGLPVLLVTHDPADAAATGGGIVELGA